MGRIIKFGDFYYVEFEARGLKYQQKAGNDMKQAQDLLTVIEEKIRNGELQTLSREMSINVFLEEFLKFALSQHSAVTLTRFRELVGHFEKYLKEKMSDVVHVSQVTPKRIEQYKADLRKSTTPQKVNLSLILLYEIFDYATRCGLLNDNPVLHVPFLPNDSRSVPQYLSSQAQNSILIDEYNLLESWAKLYANPAQAKNLNPLIIRNTFARHLIFRRISYGKICQYLRFKDIAKLLYYVPYIIEFNRNLRNSFEIN